MNKIKTIKIKDLLHKVDAYLENKQEISEINEAYLYALKSHTGIKRKNGEDFITHPLNVAYILADLNVDKETIIGALLHETINHGTGSYEEITELFGEEMTKIVKSISKINKLELQDDKESSSLSLRKILVGLSENVRVLFIKLADRLHNMRTIWVLSPDEQKQKATETMNVLIPIAHRLGINKIKSELEDLCLKYLKPDVYEDIVKNLNNTQDELNDKLQEMKESITNILKDYGMNFEIKARVKSIYSIYNKLSNGRKFSDIYDILALRIIFEKESDCYLAIGLIHAKYRPIPKRFKDYIAMPKENMYQSLHTTVFGIDGYLFEIQLRTYEMDLIAEKGIASHWSYKEKGTQKIQSLMEQKLELFRNLIESNSDSLADPNFANDVSKEFINNLIYVFTPKGDVVELPQNSTPIDFAYRIHSGVGDKTVGAIVNDVIVPLNHPLKDGDIVKIRTSNGAHPNKAWLKFVQTSQAKNKIKAYFSKIDRANYIEKGKNLLDKELKKRKIESSKFYSSKNIESICQFLKIKDLDELYLGIGTLRYLPNYVIDLNYEDKSSNKEALINITPRPNKITGHSDIIVDGKSDIKTILASCCSPINGDEIIGYVTKNKGIYIHRRDCPNVLEERTVPVSWKEEGTNSYLTSIIIETNSNNDNLLEIISRTSGKNIQIERFDKREDPLGITYYLHLKIKSIKNLNEFINDLKKAKYVKEVTRRNI